VNGKDDRAHTNVQRPLALGTTKSTAKEKTIRYTSRKKAEFASVPRSPYSHEASLGREGVNPEAPKKKRGGRSSGFRRQSRGDQLGNKEGDRRQNKNSEKSDISRRDPIGFGRNVKACTKKHYVSTIC